MIGDKRKTRRRRALQSFGPKHIVRGENVSRVRYKTFIRFSPHRNCICIPFYDIRNRFSILFRNLKNFNIVLRQPKTYYPIWLHQIYLNYWLILVLRIPCFYFLDLLPNLAYNLNLICLNRYMGRTFQPRTYIFIYSTLSMQCSRHWGTRNWATSKLSGGCCDPLLPPDVLMRSAANPLLSVSARTVTRKAMIVTVTDMDIHAGNVCGVFRCIWRCLEVDILRFEVYNYTL